MFLCVDLIVQLGRVDLLVAGAGYSSEIRQEAGDAGVIGADTGRVEVKP